MGMLKRFFLFVFVIAALVSVGVLSVLWFAWEPLLSALTWLTGMTWFFVLVGILILITAVGLITILIRALIAPDIASLMFERTNGSIAITQTTIKSTVRRVVEAHPGLNVTDISADVASKRNPRILIHATIDAGRNAELDELGTRLQNEIAATLEAFTGYPVKSVRITFTGDADVVTPAFTQRATQPPDEMYPPSDGVEPHPQPKEAPAMSSPSKNEPEHDVSKPSRPHISMGS